VAYGRQLPNLNAHHFAAHLRAFNYPAQSNVRGYADRKRCGFATIFTSNSFAAYRKSLLARVDYFKNGLIFGEDTCTVGRLLQEGYKVAYTSEAAVYHSHNYTLSQEFRRSFDIGVLHTTEKWLLDTYGSAEGRGKEYVLSGLHSLVAAGKYLTVFEFIVRNFLKILGYKAGRNYLVIPGKMRSHLSMNPGWWHRNL